jgi:hypothetical protein
MRRRELIRGVIYSGLAGLGMLQARRGFAVPATGNEQGALEAEAFFASFEFRIDQIGDDSARIVATSPSAMFCPFTFGTDQAFGQMRFMDMTSPAISHVVPLDGLKPGTRYYLQLNAVLPDATVYKSRTVSFITVPGDRGVDSLMQGEGMAQIAVAQDAAGILSGELELSQLKSKYALLRYYTFKPAFSAIGLHSDDSEGILRRMALVEPTFDHAVQLVGLKARQDYRTRAIFVDSSGRVYRSDELRFTTPESSGYLPDGINVALLESGARVSSVSSEWSPGFAGQMAINGDDSTEWASDGDGNNATIEITLAHESRVHAIGFWTRTMGSSAQVSRFTVSTDDGKEHGPFEIPDATQPYYFDIPPTVTHSLRFTVVDSNGGRTGAVSIEAYSQ